MVSASELWNTMRHIRDQDSDLYWTLHGLWQDKNEEERYNKLSPEEKAQEDQEKMERMRRSNRNTMFPVNERQVTSKTKQRKETKETKTNSKKPNRIKTRVKMQEKQDNIFRGSYRVGGKR